jgi:hypothetical protein
LILANTLDDTLRTATEEAWARSFRELNGGAQGDRDRLRVASASLDRPGLEAIVCECYQVVKTEVDRLFG